MKINYRKYQLQFKQPAGTSRGVYKSRWVWYVFIEENGVTGIGECAPLPGLSEETQEEVEQLLNRICANPDRFIKLPQLYQAISSVTFAIETALTDLRNGGTGLLFPSAFTRGEKGIPINGLIWMGDLDFMKSQIKEKLDAGFRCIKLKIGALNFEEELELLKAIRKEYTTSDLLLRVDANGAFSMDNAMEKLERLAELHIHSIEQPIAAGKWEAMADLCRNSSLPIALDEELTGTYGTEKKQTLIQRIKPQFLILKPGLHGGFSGCDEWIRLAEEQNIDWWITSYLESNIGLNAIAQWTFLKNVSTHQGLGTGQLFNNNFSCPLEIRDEKLWFNPEKQFQLPMKHES